METKKLLKGISSILSVGIFYIRHGKHSYISKGIENGTGFFDGDELVLKNFESFSNTKEPLIALWNNRYSMAFINIHSGEKKIVIGPMTIEGQLFYNHKMETDNDLQDFPAPILTLENVMNTMVFILDNEGISTTKSKIFNQNFIDRNELSMLANKTDQSMIKALDDNVFHRSFDQVSRLENCVREGNMNTVFDVYKENLVIYENKEVVDLQTQKYMTVSGLAIITRAAIKGGVQYELAYALSDNYIKEIDAATTTSQIDKIYYQIVLQFTKLSFDFKNGGFDRDENYYTMQAVKYITKNINRPITVIEIAEHLGITPNYLSAVFKDGEGMTITEYINISKISIAKKMLNFSNASISRIAASLGYSSQSHFGRKFKEATGMSPKQYLVNKKMDENNEFKMVKREDSN